MNKGNRFWAYIKARGFYIALALCITGASAAAWYTATGTIDKINESNSQATENISHSTEENQWAAQSQSEVSKPSQSSVVSSSAPSSLAAASSSSSRPAASAASSSRSSGSSAPAAQPGCVYSSPLPGGRVINAYSNGQLVKNYTLNVWRTHDAVDIAAAEGAEVLAACEGVVLSVVSDPLWGGVVKLEHADGTITAYSGVTASEKLAEGEQVAYGQAIGTVGQIASEISMEPHIHFAVIQSGKAVDPAGLIAELGTAQE